MKPALAALAAALLLWPQGAQAQGYAGVMPPQAGYHPPAAASATPLPSAPQNSPYSGTGASQATGYANLMNSDGSASQQVDTAPQGMPDDDDKSTARTGSAFQKYFQPKDKADDGSDTPGSSIYDTVDDNGTSPMERRRKAIMRKIDADERKAQHDMDVANRQRDAQIDASVRKAVRDNERKLHGDDADGADDDTDDQPADQAADPSSDQPDAGGGAAQ